VEIDTDDARTGLEVQRDDFRVEVVTVVGGQIDAVRAAAEQNARSSPRAGEAEAEAIARIVLLTPIATGVVEGVASLEKEQLAKIRPGLIGRREQQGGVAWQTILAS
jgi:hypothetical protein